MTFWDKYYELCLLHHTKPNPVAKELGFSSSTCTQWKKGATPSSKTVSLIADYFGVSADYLLNDIPAPALIGENVQNNVNGNNTINITSADDEQLLNLLKQMDIVQRSKAIVAISEILKENDNNG